MEDMDLLITADIQSLEKALAKNESEARDRSVFSLERRLLNNRNYLKLGDERVISLVIQLLSQVYEEEILGQLEPISDWLEVIRDTNDKFYAILNHEIGLDDLLLFHLLSWKSLSEDLICVFDDTVKQSLKAAREKTNSEQKLRSFMSIFIDYIQKIPLLDISELKRVCELVLANYRKLNQWNSQALFSIGITGNVYGIKIKATPNGMGTIESLSEIDPEMKKAARGAFTFIKGKYPAAKTWDVNWEIARGDIPFKGNSIGLALSIGILSTTEGFDVDSYTAFTGHVEWDTGDVKSVGEIAVKLQAAKDQGIRRVFIPIENSKDVIDNLGLDIIAVSTVEEARNKLTVKAYVSSNIPIEKQAELKLKQLEIELTNQGIKATGPIQDGNSFKRIEFTDYRDRVFVNIYYGKNGLTANVQAKNCPLRNNLQAACDQVVGKAIAGITDEVKRDKLTITDQETQKRVEHYLFSLPSSFRESEQNCQYRSKINNNGQTVRVRQFNNGTLTIEGQSPLFTTVISGIHAVLGISSTPKQENLKSIKLAKQVDAVKSVSLGDLWIGTDEAGKGDYFGPLVGAAVLVDKNIANQLIDIGVKDSKDLSDKRNRELAAQITAICGKRAQVVLIPPARYNALYGQFKKESKNLNTLLAWVHTRALEDILTAFPQKHITVIVDKFADEQYIKSKLLENSRRTDLNLVQLPKAEANVAVAAASILARAQFLLWLERSSQQLNISLPKGASDPRIVQVAQHIVKTHGREKLAEYAKLHFKTTNEVLS
jgi:ribonuclease HIII